MTPEQERVIRAAKAWRTAGEAFAAGNKDAYGYTSYDLVNAVDALLLSEQPKPRWYVSQGGLGHVWRYLHGPENVSLGPFRIPFAEAMADALNKAGV